MSLQRTIILLVIGLLVFLLFGNMVVSVLNARSYFAAQMRSLSEDTATSLGLTISHAAKAKDIAKIETMINVIFDRGYYLSINYSDLNGKVITSRARKIAIEGVPSWFVNRLNIPSRSGSAEVVSGWFRLGSIHVVSHPGYAYQDLWRVFVNQLWLFLVSIVLSYGFLGILLKILLRPLTRLESQAQSVVNEEFVVNEKIPRTLELRSLAYAMNKMVEKIRDMFNEQIELSSKLRKENHTDYLTGLPNQKEFDARVLAALSSEDGGGQSALALVSINNIMEINHIKGRAVVDELICTLAQVLSCIHSQWPNALVGRRHGADFGVFIPGFFVYDVDHIVEYLHTEMERLGVMNLGVDEFSSGYPIRIGFAFSQGDSGLADLLKAADEANRVADARNLKFSTAQSLSRIDEPKGAAQWLAVLERVIDEKDIVLHTQKIQLNDNVLQKWVLGKQKGQRLEEVFCRIEEGGKVIVAGVFWSLLERYSMVARMDKIVVEKALNLLIEHDDLSLMINISLQSTLECSFRQWLVKAVQNQDSERVKRIIFEMPERALINHNVEAESFIRELKKIGVAISLDRFGLQPASLGSLQELNVDMVKVDRRFISGIDQHKENRFYIQTLMQITHASGTLLLVDGVETDEEKNTLIEIGVDGLQGFNIDRPSAL